MEFLLIIIGVILLVLLFVWLCSQYYQSNDGRNYQADINELTEVKVDDRRPYYALSRKKKVEHDIFIKAFKLIDGTGRIAEAYLNNCRKLPDEKTDWSKVLPGVKNYDGAIERTALLLKNKANGYQKQEIISLVNQLIQLRERELDNSSSRYEGHLHVVDQWKKFKHIISAQYYV